jgi:hypothetical protein
MREIHKHIAGMERAVRKDMAANRQTPAFSRAVSP